MSDAAATRDLPSVPAVAVIDDQPFVLNTTFRPVEPLNDRLASLPSRGCRDRGRARVGRW